MHALKKDFDVKSYEEVIRALIRIKKLPEKSYFGKFRKLQTFEREEIDRFD